MPETAKAGLERVLHEFIEGLAGRDPASARLAVQFRYTENGQVLAAGDGLWATADALGAYRHILSDPITGQAAYIGLAVENGRDIILALRIRVADGVVHEAEAVVSRGDILFYKGGTEQLKRLGAPVPVWSQGSGAGLSREDMAAMADAYFSALERNDGRKSVPIAEACRRLDNGVWATQAPEFDPPGEPPFYALGPAEQLKLGYFAFVTAIRDRRYPIIDEARGVVFSLAFFDHAGTVHQAHLTDGRTVPIALAQPFSWQIAEIFKIEQAHIAQIEVVLSLSPYGMRPNWE